MPREEAKILNELELTVKRSPAQRAGIFQTLVSEWAEYSLLGTAEGLEKLNSAVVKTIGGEHPQRMTLKFNGKDGEIFLFLGAENLILTEIQSGLILSGDSEELKMLSIATTDCIKNLSSPLRVEGYHSHIDLFDLTMPFKPGDARRVGELTIACAALESKRSINSCGGKS